MLARAAVAAALIYRNRHTVVAAHHCGSSHSGRAWASAMEESLLEYGNNYSQIYLCISTHTHHCGAWPCAMRSANKHALSTHPCVHT